MQQVEQKMKFFISHDLGSFLQYTRENEVPYPFDRLSELSQLESQREEYEIHVVPGAERHEFVEALKNSHTLYIENTPWTPE